MPLSAVPEARFIDFVQAAKHRRLVLYLGAGISVAEPSGGPTGPTVANALRPFVAQMLETDEENLTGLSLEALAQRVAAEAHDRLEELRIRAASAFDFRGMEPNFGHEAAALLLREGLVQLISVNWDCGIEQAGLEAGVAIQGVADLAQSLELSHDLLIYKVHGCAKRPSTLAITQDEVDAPQTWAISRTQNALTGGVVVFVGLGTIGLYVEEPFADLVSTWASPAATFAFVDPQLPEPWRLALGDEQAAHTHIPRTADAFLDELLRAVIRDALDNAELLTGQLAHHEQQWGATMLTGLRSLRQGLETASADGVVHWWRDGMVATQAGSPFITELSGQTCLMTVGLLVGVDRSAVEIAGVRGRQTVASAMQYFEIVSRPGQHVKDVQAVATHRVERRHAEDVYGGGKPVTIVLVDALGELPAGDAPLDIAAGDEESEDIATGAIRMRFVTAEDGVQGRLGS